MTRADGGPVLPGARYIVGMKRCRCHSSDLYATLRPCPRCRHWSFDPIAQSCERRRCGYVAP